VIEAMEQAQGVAGTVKATATQIKAMPHGWILSVDTDSVSQQC